MLRVGIQEKPPLLQTYILPSGPSAAPFGPPGIFATTSLRPSGQTRVSRCPRISTSTTEPSGITTGPSGNSRSVARTRILAMKILPALLAAGGFLAGPRARNILGGGSYGKVALGCQPDANAHQLLHRAHRVGDVRRTWSLLSQQVRQDVEPVRAGRLYIHDPMRQSHVSDSRQQTSARRRSQWSRQQFGSDLRAPIQSATISFDNLEPLRI